jgi:hypothetical protein
MFVGFSESTVIALLSKFVNLFATRLDASKFKPQPQVQADRELHLISYRDGYRPETSTSTFHYFLRTLSRHFYDPTTTAKTPATET